MEGLRFSLEWGGQEASEATDLIVEEMRPTGSEREAQMRIYG
jgi:hypothetical protein